MPSVRTPDPNPGWLSEFALDETRSRVPILYVEAIPVRLDGMGKIERLLPTPRIDRFRLCHCIYLDVF